MNKSFQPLTLTTALAKCMLSLFSLLTMSGVIITPNAQANSVPILVAAIKFKPPSPPPNRGAPGSRGEAASRGCGLSNQSLKALMPVYEQTLNQSMGKSTSITQVWGLTSFQNPTFWFSVPYTSSSITAMEFVLQNQQNKTILRIPVTIPKTPGIVNFRLPSTFPALEMGLNYHWFFKVRLACDSQQPTELDYVEGWVQRTHLNAKLGDRLKQATPKQQVALYAENGLWYDTLTTLAELRLTNPKDTALLADWTSLLQSIGLDELVNQPLVKCCLPQQ